jgi:4-hydroxyproline epimerase
MRVSDSGRVTVVDSHTGGEPTRVVVMGGPELGSSPIFERAQRFRDEHAHFRQAIVLEPRGSDVLVGALLCAPIDPLSTAGVIFFNNVDILGMCGHGTIGLAVTLAYLGRIQPGEHRFETPVGTVTATLHNAARVTIRNVPSYRKVKGLTVTLPNGSKCTGDVAWGGNWFFLINDHRQELKLRRSSELLAYAIAARDAVRQAGFPEVDHVELFGPPETREGNSRNFVLCPGGAYDRSPCGTGTSAKLACLAADGKLAEGADWVQESVVGSTFTGRYRWIDRLCGTIAPEITGSAYITAETTLVFDPADPLCWGIPPQA